MQKAASKFLSVGDIQITSLSDGMMAIPYRRLFPETPEEVWDAYRERFPAAFDSNAFHTNIGVFLVRSGDRAVLVDTGLGPDGAAGGRPGPPELMDDLQASAIARSDIDTVFITHLHGDHIGWNLAYSEEGWTPSFPNARYLLQEADWRHFTAPERLEGRRDAAERTYLPLDDLGVLQLLSGEQEVAPGLTALPTPGHTPGHMSMLIASRNERALIIGDVVGSPMHVTETHHTYNPDWDRQQAIETRLRLLDMAEQEGRIVLGSHMTRPGWGRIIRWQGKRYWQAL